MERMKIRLLNADEIECRISMIKDKGLSLLLYKDARVDQRILDETFGVFGWKRSHQSIDGNLYCTVEIFDKESKTWIAKQDVGTTGYTEKEKSQASDSFKRACFNWGIGRELYSAPFIWIPSSKVNIQKENGKCVCNERFEVASIEYNEKREISELQIKDGKGNIVYSLFRQRSEPDENTNLESKKLLTKKQLESFNKELERTGVEVAKIKERYCFDQPENMSQDMYNKVMTALSKTKSA